MNRHAPVGAACGGRLRGPGIAVGSVRCDVEVKHRGLAHGGDRGALLGAGHRGGGKPIALALGGILARLLHLNGRIGRRGEDPRTR